MNSSVLKRYIQVSSIIITVIIIFISFVIITSSYGQNTPPIANAGPTQTVNSTDRVTLDASNSYDPNRHLSPFPFAQNEDNLYYHWRQVAGKNVTLSNTSIVNPTFIAPNVSSVTPLNFSLVVDNGNFSSPPSSVVIIVNPLQKSSAAAPSESNSSQSKQLDGLFFAFILILLAAAAISIIRDKSRRHRERRYFPESVKKEKLRLF